MKEDGTPVPKGIYRICALKIWPCLGEHVGTLPRHTCRFSMCRSLHLALGPVGERDSRLRPRVVWISVSAECR